MVDIISCDQAVLILVIKMTSEHVACFALFIVFLSASGNNKDSFKAGA